MIACANAAVHSPAATKSVPLLTNVIMKQTNAKRSTTSSVVTISAVPTPLQASVATDCAALTVTAHEPWTASMWTSMVQSNMKRAAIPLFAMLRPSFVNKTSR